MPDEHGWIADRPVWIYNCFDVRRKAVSLSVGTSHHPSVLRFGVFEMDLALGELRKNGILVKLPPQPFKVLALLATHRGQVVTREEIQQQIWGSDTFVDFEQGMNHCIKQIRNVLSDSAETPRFVETLPRRGYRFIAPVEQPEAGRPILANTAESFREEAGALATLPATEVKPLAAPEPAVGQRHWYRQRRLAIVVGAAASVLASAVVVLWLVRAEEPSVAVLPFVDMSPDKSQEYFSEGLAEELRSGLARVEGLRVTGRTSSSQFKGNAVDARVIGKKLHVATLLEGSVRRQGDRARIAVQLIKSGDGFQLWSETYDREMRDIFAVEDGIARAVTTALKVKLWPGKPVGTSAKSTTIEAYNAYLEARYFYRRRNKPDLEKAINYFTQATRLDPTYAPAWAGLGRSRMAQADRGYLPGVEGYRLGRQAVQRALALDPDLAEGHATMGSIQKDYDWDWTGANASYQRALALAPGSASVAGDIGDLLWILGQQDNAIAMYRRALASDPLDNNLHFNLGLILHSAAREEEARAALTKALELAPDMEVIHFTLCRIDLIQSRSQEALAEAEKEKHPVFRLLGLALANYALRRREADANLTELIVKFGADDPYQIADLYAFRGEADQAFAWLDRAYSARDPGLVEIKTDTLMNTLKSDPRYLALLKKMRLPL